MIFAPDGTSLRSSLRPTIPSAEAPMADPRIAKIAATLNAAAAVPGSAESADQALIDELLAALGGGGNG